MESIGSEARARPWGRGRSSCSGWAASRFPLPTVCHAVIGHAVLSLLWFLPLWRRCVPRTFGAAQWAELAATLHAWEVGAGPELPYGAHWGVWGA